MLENLIIPQDIRDKLLRDDHNVKEDEVRECFLNHDGFYIDTMTRIMLPTQYLSGLSARLIEDAC